MASRKQYQYWESSHGRGRYLIRTEVNVHAMRHSTDAVYARQVYRTTGKPVKYTRYQAMTVGELRWYYSEVSPDFLYPAELKVACGL